MKAEFIEGLRKMADFLEAHPEVNTSTGIRLDIWLSSKEQIADVARRFPPFTKRYSEQFFMLNKEFGPDLCIEWNVNRDQVCELVVTKETVTRPVYVAQGEETVEIEHKEWICTEPILAH